MGPAVLVDGFAGSGKFEDGSPGSPLIMANLIQKNNALLSSNGKENHRLIVIEQNPTNYQSLNKILSGFQFAESHNCEFCSMIPAIESIAKQRPMFIYLDPFAVKGVNLVKMASLFKLASEGKSIELLMNVNVVAFARAAMAISPSSVEDGAIDGEEELSFPMRPSTETLDSYAGGTWWKDCIVNGSFEKTYKNFLDAFILKLRGCFSEVCFHEMHASASSAFPKYVLAFGSRHPEALKLMNDEMVKSRDDLVESTRPAESTLFETLPERLVPDRSRIAQIVWESLPAEGAGEARKNVIYKAIRSAFGQFLVKDYRAHIEELLKTGKACSETGNYRINGEVKIWKSGI